MRKLLANMIMLPTLTALCAVSPSASAKEEVAPEAVDLAGFEFRSVMNHKCLEILAFDNSNGAYAGMWDCWGGANQKWSWGSNGEIRNDMNGKCLEILGFNNDNGAIVGMWDCWGGANQKWYRGPNGELRSQMNHKCVDILNFDETNGAWAGMWDCWGAANQRWY